MPHCDRRQFARRLAQLGALGLGLPPLARAGDGDSQAAPTRVRLWCEGTAPRQVYPDEIDGALAQGLAGNPALSLARARLSDPDAGLADADLDRTDVLVWWGRLRHDDVPEARARAVVERVKDGRLGLIALHGAYASKPFLGLMGAACAPRSWREDGGPERVAVKDPAHPIARGVTEFTIPRTAMYAEPFAVPEPEAVVLVSTFGPGESFRSGLTWTVGRGRVAYLRPGHDGYPVLFHPMLRRVVANAVLWTARKA